MPFVVTCCVISAVVVVVVAVADSAVFWHFLVVWWAWWPLSVYLSTMSLGGDARIERDCGGGIGAVRGHLRRAPAVVVVVVAVAFGGFVVLSVAWWALAASPRSI